MLQRKTNISSCKIIPLGIEDNFGLQVRLVLVVVHRDVLRHKTRAREPTGKFSD